MDPAEIRAHAHQILRDATIPELPNHYSGKVRDNYDLADGRRIIVIDQDALRDRAGARPPGGL